MPNYGVVTYVHDWYHGYIPFFIRAWQLAYPEYQIRIFCDKVQKQYDGAELIEMPNPHESKKPYYLRWLIPPEKLAGLDYAFICDVDLLAMRESRPLHETRIACMRNKQRPFANWVRARAEGYPNRVTGWHFIEVEPYYDKVWPLAEKVLHDRLFNIANPPSYKYDNGLGEFQWGQEALLYQLLTAAFGLNDQDVADWPWFANHHGLHLGPLRNPLTTSRLKVAERLWPNTVFWYDIEQARQILNDPGIQAAYLVSEQPRVTTIMTKLYNMFGLLNPAQTSRRNSAGE